MKSRGQECHFPGVDREEGSSQHSVAWLGWMVVLGQKRGVDSTGALEDTS